MMLGLAKENAGCFQQEKLQIFPEVCPQKDPQKTWERVKILERREPGQKCAWWAGYLQLILVVTGVGRISSGYHPIFLGFMPVLLTSAPNIKRCISVRQPFKGPFPQLLQSILNTYLFTRM